MNQQPGTVQIIIHVCFSLTNKYKEENVIFIRDVDIFVRPVCSFDFYILKYCSYVSKLVMNNTVMMHTKFF